MYIGQRKIRWMVLSYSLISFIICRVPITILGHAVARLRHCGATSWKYAGSIPDGVTGIFRWHDPSGRTVDLGLTWPLTEMSTRNIYLGGKGGRCMGLTILPTSRANCLEIWDPQPPGTLWASSGLYWNSFTFLPVTSGSQRMLDKFWFFVTVSKRLVVFVKSCAEGWPNLVH